MRKMTKPLLSVLFIVVMMISYANQAFGADTNQKPGNQPAQKSWLDEVKNSFTYSETTTDSSVLVMVAYLVMG